MKKALNPKNPKNHINNNKDIKDKLFEKILIANRGEIACRIIKTCRRLGIRTVAVYSEADIDSLHTKLADERVCIGPAPSQASYLNIEAIVKACKQTGAQAVHPGYGFLSENSHFTERLNQEKIGFIGPPMKAMQDLGDKIASKIIAKKAGVPCVPGYDGAVPDVATAIRVVHDVIGSYPVMIKASAGGGGKGMRVARSDDDMREFLPRAASEALSSFGDDRLLVEKFIEAPRHIEVQILADEHGKVLYLPERDCSIQRRNQKVIEEAPSPALTKEKRQSMGQCAAKLAAAVQYASAGTVEFLYDNDTHDFYFLEMNTRLQVEHPITELITGLDLVEQMIRVAAGYPLSLTQDDVSHPHGWAVETRIYAEDPTNNYMPSIGQLIRYQEPIKPREDRVGPLENGKDEKPIIRCDSGIQEGSEISVYYDPMICKLCTWAPTRLQALDEMTLALDEFVVQGVVHNKNLLRQVIMEPTFRDDPTKITTKFLSTTYPQGFHGHQLTTLEQTELAAGAMFMHTELQRQGFMPLATEFALTRSSFYAPQHFMNYWISVDGGKTFFHTCMEGVSRCKLTRNEETTILDVLMQPWKPYDPILRFKMGDHPVTMQLEERTSPNEYQMSFLGTIYKVVIRTDLEHELHQFVKTQEKKYLGNVVTSPMPGMVIKVTVKEGDTVQINQDLCVIEAMKMQNLLKSNRQGRIKRVNIKVGDSVTSGQVLIEYDE